MKSVLSDKKTESAQLSSGFGKLDSDGDGKLSASELSSALAAFKPALFGGSSQAAVQA